MTRHHTKPEAAETDIARRLGIDRPVSPGKRVQRWLVVVLLIGGMAAVAMVLIRAGSRHAPRYETLAARRGTLTVTVTTTGTIEPMNQVEVGSELSGRIETVRVDYNDHVQHGQVLATLDTEQLQARLVQARASLEVAQAKVLQATATVTETKQKLQRATALASRNLLSQQDLEDAQVAYARAQAEEASAKANVTLARAMLDADRTNLAKAVIRSPIDGVVIARHIEPGQTLAAAFQTPILFTLGDDLTHMKLHVDIDEADIGHVRDGQEATFTVDAYPEHRFTARITSVRNAPRTVQGVVTYEAILAVDNTALLLRPGMTATADIITAQLTDALLVPNGALRFSPPDMTESARSQDEVPGTEKSQGRVWTLREGRPVPIPVTTGLSNGRWTEVLGGQVEPGLPLLVNVLRSKA